MKRLLTVLLLCILLCFSACEKDEPIPIGSKTFSHKIIRKGKRIQSDTLIANKGKSTSGKSNSDSLDYYGIHSWLGYEKQRVDTIYIDTIRTYYTDSTYTDEVQYHTVSTTEILPFRIPPHFVGVPFSILQEIHIPDTIQHYFVFSNYSTDSLELYVEMGNPTDGFYDVLVIPDSIIQLTDEFNTGFNPFYVNRIEYRAKHFVLKLKNYKKRGFMSFDIEVFNHLGNRVTFTNRVEVVHPDSLNY